YKINSEVADTYSHYHNYKTDFVKILDETYKASQAIRYIGDKENSNTDSALVATKRCLIFNELNKRLYRKFFMRHDELDACKDGYIYIHDQSARLDTINCDLFDVASVMHGGFEMGNIHYNEPKTLDTAFDVLGDIILSCASQQYGGFTVPEIDKILKPYAEKSYTKYRWECLQLCGDLNKSNEWAMGKVKRDFEQGYQGLEMKLNSVGSSRGDYPFITISFGLGVEHFERMCTQTILEVHAKGQGADGHKKPVLFPKLVFLYDSKLHGESCINNDLFECALECSSKTMYPDYLSLEHDEIYQKYGVAISPMGCFKGDHVLGFMQQDIPFAQSIERTWDWLSSTVPVKTQIEGQPHKYIDVSNLNFKVWDTAKQDYVKVNTFIRNVQDNWVNVKLSNGRYLDVTSDHPFETENRGVVQAKNLVLGDKIKANYGAPTFTESGEINNSLAWLYGAMLCDGCYQNYSVFASFGVDEEDVIDKFIGAFQENYKLAPEVKLQKRGKKGTYYDVRVKSSLVHSLKSLINEFTSVFGGVQKIYRHIPSFIWNSNRENKLHFLAGMFDADGSIKYDDGLASLGSTNHELAYEQMYLIQSLGMPCKIRKNYYKGKQNSDKYRVAVDFYPTAELIECLTSQKKVNNFAGEKHFKNTPDVVEVIGLDMVEGTDYAYDLSTESAHFEVNGVYSHNCRAFLSPWYKKGGMAPVDDTDKPVFVGRFNMGVVSLHLPMILAKARKENKDFYEVLDFYLEMIRRIHKRTIDYLGEMRASTNPVGFCEGGFYGGHLKPSDKIKPLLKAMTISFGITALNELQRLYNGKSLVEDGAFALEVMEHINCKIEQYKKEDGILYAIYGTPAESLCGKQVEQFRKLYGIVEGVSDRAYVSNSFHCHVTEDISPILKQDLEERFWHLFAGGRIQYVRYPLSYNIDAIRTLVTRAMKKGFYEGVNMALAYCDDCGADKIEGDVCPVCGSKNLTKIDRMNGYLSYSRIKGDTRLNSAKMAELSERKSM
ncbi:MAG: anaerobic ribonucleoside-triphosphate reductase, partial [Cellulosilyticum sp.]|nr:anaerobic ribonucleoside-triphosphate reductase [Cellulosilyticum sp.]